MRKSESAVSRCKTISTVQKLLCGKYKIEIGPRGLSQPCLKNSSREVPPKSQVPQNSQTILGHLHNHGHCFLK